MKKQLAFWMLTIIVALVSGCKEDGNEEPKVQPGYVTSFSPEMGYAGDQITLYGKNFSPVLSENIVEFSGVQAEVLKTTDSELTVIVPESTTGTIQYNGRTNIQTEFFYYAEVKSINPAQGKVGSLITITGTNLLNVYSVGLKSGLREEFVSDIISHSDNQLVVRIQPPLLYVPEMSLITKGQYPFNEFYIAEGPNTFTLIDSWEPKQSLPVAMPYNGSSFAIGNKMYLGLGQNVTTLKDFWLYDPTIDDWQPLNDFDGPARNHALHFSLNGKGYVGTGTTVYGSDPLKDMWRYDPDADKWTQLNDFPEASYIGIAMEIDGKIYAGIGAQQTSFYEYDAIADTWTPKANCPVSGGHFASFTLDGKGYIAGGFNNRLHCWQYDPLLDEWKQVASLPYEEDEIPTPLKVIGFALDGKGYIGMENALAQYDPSTNSWIKMQYFPERRIYNVLNSETKAFVLSDEAKMYEFLPE